MYTAWCLQRFYENNFLASAGSVAKVKYSVDCKNTLPCQMHAVYMVWRLQTSTHEYSRRIAAIGTQYTC